MRPPTIGRGRAAEDPGADPGVDPAADDEEGQGTHRVPTELDAWGKPKKGSHVVCETPEAASHWDARIWNRVS